MEPNIFNYSNYRVFLREYYEARKRSFPGFSHRYFAKKARLASPNYLKLVIDGKRNLSKKTITAFLLGLDMSGKKAEFFENLVFFNQATTLTERNYFYERLLKARARSGLKKLEEAQFQLFSDWKHIAIREMVALAGFRKNPNWIARRLGLRITEKEAEESLRLLVTLGLLGRTANGYKQKDTNITTSDEVRSLLVKNYHRQMLNLAVESMDRIPAAMRDISSVTIPIRKGDLARVKEHLQLMRKELLNLAAEPDAGEEIVQVNMQLFPLTSPG